MVSLTGFCWLLTATVIHILLESCCLEPDKILPRKLDCIVYMEFPGSQIPGHASSDARASLYRGHAEPRVDLCTMSRLGATSNIWMGRNFMV